MREVDIPKMAIQTRYVHFEFPVHYVIWSIKCLDDFHGPYELSFRMYLYFFVIEFIVNILIESRSENNHTIYLRVVLQILKNDQLFNNFNKCKFFLRSVVFVCNIVSN